MIQVYCGDGKGKTTAAVGQTVRAAGRGFKVVFVQFLKGEDSGERAVLKTLSGVTVLDLPDEVKFTFAMDESEKQRECTRQTEQFEKAVSAADGAALLVLDELCAAVNAGMVPLDSVIRFLEEKPEDLEVVITGRNPPDQICAHADYITEMRKIRHPFDKGIHARPGIEY